MNNVDDGRPAPIGKLKLLSAPRVRQVYWCTYPTDAILPEFWKKRPVVVISRNATLTGPVSVLPITTFEQEESKWSVHLRSPIGGQKDAWIVCNQPTTFSVARLVQPGRAIPTVPKDIFSEAIQLLHRHIVGPRSA